MNLESQLTDDEMSLLEDFQEILNHEFTEEELETFCRLVLRAPVEITEYLVEHYD